MTLPSRHARIVAPALACSLAAAALADPSAASDLPPIGDVRTIVVDPEGASRPDVEVVPTLEVAIAAIERGSASRPHRIELVPGVHFVTRGLRLAADAPPLVIRASAPGVRLLGGERLDPAGLRNVDEATRLRLPEVARASVRVIDLASFAAEASRPRWEGGLAGPGHLGHVVEVASIQSELFVGGRALVLARWPNAGFAEIESVPDPGSIPRNAADDVPLSERRVEPPRGGTFIPRERARVARWAAAEDGWAAGYWNWDWSDEQLPIERIDLSSGAVVLGMPHRYGLASRGRFYVTNVLEELDAPGEYCVDADGGAVYVWPPEEGAVADEAGREWVVSLLAAPMLTLDGARDVAVEGISFEASRGAGIVARGVERVTFDSCAFRNLGTHGIVLSGSACAIRRSSFVDLGGKGVALAGGDRGTLTPSGNAIEDCVFRGCGRILRTYNPAIDLDGVGHRIVRNEISMLPHVAIFMRGNDHLVEANDVHRVVLETGDAGAIYCGRDWTSHGNVIRGNLFHEIRGTDVRFQNAVYLDDMASGFLVEDNLFVGCNWGILAGGGRDNLLRRNAFLGCGKAICYDARGVGWMAPHIADPSTSTLHRNLAAMPIHAEPWRSRFPTLGGYLVDRFGRPVGSRVEGSLLVGTPLGRIDDRECVIESETREAAWGVEGMPESAGAAIDAARSGTLDLLGIRIGPVGPRR